MRTVTTLHFLVMEGKWIEGGGGRHVLVGCSMLLVWSSSIGFIILIEFIRYIQISAPKDMENCTEFCRKYRILSSKDLKVCVHCNNIGTLAFLSKS